jgi:hypothetical protein
MLETMFNMILRRRVSTGILFILPRRVLDEIGNDGNKDVHQENAPDKFREFVHFIHHLLIQIFSNIVPGAHSVPNFSVSLKSLSESSPFVNDKTIVIVSECSIKPIINWSAHACMS